MTGTTTSTFSHARQAPPSRLIIEKGEHQGMIFPLRDSVISIGRGPDNTIQIIDARMSRNHSLVISNDGNWYARDLGSKNGTLLNDLPIKGDTPLSMGDSLQIGDTVFVYEQEAAAQETAGPVTTGLRLTEGDGVMVASQVYKMRQDLGRDAELTGVFSVPTRDADRIDVIYQVSDMISTILDLDLLLERLVDLVQKYFCPDRVGILLYDEKYGVMVPKAIRRPADSTEDIVISNSIITQAVDDRVAVLVSDAPHDLRFKASDSIAIQRIHSAICAPLLYKNEGLGVLYLDRRRPNGSFDENDLKLIAAVAHQAALAIANTRMHMRLLEQHTQEMELRIARTIQEHLLPKEFPQLSGFDIYGLSRPAHMVGGDYFDMIELQDGRILIVIADVSGKGVPAAILLASVRAAVQVEARGLPGMGLLELVGRLNHMVCRDVSNNMFVTAFFAILDPRTRELAYCNAGHVHPMLRLPNGELQTLEMGGCFLGIMPGTLFESGTQVLMPGSVLLFYTDGMTDAMDEQREMFGQERLEALLQKTAGLPAQRACEEFENAITAFRRNQELFDDMTVLIVRSERASA